MFYRMFRHFTFLAAKLTKKALAVRIHMQYGLFVTKLVGCIVLDLFFESHNRLKKLLGRAKIVCINKNQFYHFHQPCKGIFDIISVLTCST